MCRTVYKQVLELWKDNRLVEAECVLRNFWKKCSMQSLQGMLLMAYILRDQKKYVSEVAILQDLLSRFDGVPEPDLLADAWSVLGSALRMLGESELSLQALLKGVELETCPEQRLVECSNAIFTANAISGISAERMQDLYVRYQNLLADLKMKTYPVPQWHHSVIRVGYLSADLHEHAVAQFIWPLLCAYDPSQFSVYVYRLSAIDDAVTRGLQDGRAFWREVWTLSWQDLAAKIREDEIDVLVDLSGHTAGNALPVLACRPAPVQLSGIGYFNSTGMIETSGFLSDVYCSSAEHSPYFTEPLLRMPHSHFCYHPFTEFPDEGAAPCLKNGYVTFGCFNNFAKVNDEILFLWREILKRVPDARLLLKHSLLGTEEGRNYTVQRFRRLELPLERIEFRGSSDDYLLQYQDMDIALDTSPYPGGVTTCEALYMGVPVVTLKGNRHGARFGYSFLANLNLTELVAENEAEYVDIAVKLSHDWELLNMFRENLRKMMLRSSLMNEIQYMQGIEDMYKNLKKECML